MPPPADDATTITIQSYQQGAPAYAAIHNHSGMMAKYIDLFCARLPARSRLLDAGCGPGRDLSDFADRGHQVTGLDLSPALLAQVRPGIPTVLGDLRTLPFPDHSFEAVWSVAAIHHLSKPQADLALAEFHRVLVPQGHFFTVILEGTGEGWEEDQDLGPRFYSYWSQDELEQHCRAAGLQVEWSLCERTRGKSAKVFVIASRPG